MLAADVPTMSAFLEEVRACSKPFSTLAVWFTISGFLERDTGVLTCSQRQLAKAAGMAVGDVHRALDALVEMGVLLREERGKYKVHPSAMWRGQLSARGQAEEVSPRLTLVEGGKSD